MRQSTDEHADEHYLEASRARDRYDREWTSLQRLTLLRTLIVVVMFAMVYGYFTRVQVMNKHLRGFGTRSEAELSATVAWFLTTHLTERSYTLSLDNDARLLMSIIDDIGRIHGEPVTIESRFPNQLGTLLGEARSRPDNVRLTLPYFGAMALPLGYAALAFVSAVFSFAFNLYLLFRQIELRAILLYTVEHLMVVGSPRGDEVEFAADFGAGQSIWRTTSREWDGASRLFDLATGLSWKRLSQRRFSLLEIAASVITLTGSVMLLAMGFYLSLETWLCELQQATAFILASLLAVITTVAVSLLLRLVAKHVFASTEAA